mmetsp:Transcript_24248/g.71199  ORF Transcript_24248/g.71199 Transcript_24248/m.71199 type:complete len:219 (-) Transcript_24248:1198-1854(-)
MTDQTPSASPDFTTFGLTHTANPSWRAARRGKVKLSVPRRMDSTTDDAARMSSLCPSAWRLPDLAFARMLRTRPWMRPARDRMAWGRLSAIAVDRRSPVNSRAFSSSTHVRSGRRDRRCMGTANVRCPVIKVHTRSWIRCARTRPLSSKVPRASRVAPGSCEWRSGPDMCDSMATSHTITSAWLSRTLAGKASSNLSINARRAAATSGGSSFRTSSRT